MTNNKRRHAALETYLRDIPRPILRREAERLFSEHAVKACLSEGSVHRLLPELLVHRSLANDPATRIRAAAMWTAPAGGAVTGRAGLWVWGVVKEAPPIATIMLRHPLHRAVPPWIRQYRPRTPPLTLAVRGMSVVPLAHAVVHAWNETRGQAAVGLVVLAIGGNYVSSSQVAAAARATGRVRARRQLAALLELLVHGITSYLEHRARTVVFPPSLFPELQWQVPMVVCGRDRVLDAHDPVSKTALEFDSDSWHGTVDDRVRDIERDVELASEGILPVHLDFFAVFDRAEWCRAIYRKTRASRIAMGSAVGADLSTKPPA